jgi:hypothetical protein
MVEEFTAKLEEMFVGETTKPSNYTVSIHKKLFTDSFPIWYSKTDRNIVIQFENEARIYIGLNWNLDDYLKVVEVPLRYHFIFRDYIPKCFKVYLNKQNNKINNIVKYKVD